jgi:DNA-binding NtrC family response regulator
MISAAGGVHEVADERMSRDHAKVQWDRGAWIIEDLESRNGTFVNGERIHGQVRRRGDVILRLGHTVFVLLADGRGQPGATHDQLVVGPELARVLDQVKRLARTGSTLLLQGEPGTGKDTVARLYHASGPRAAGPFVAVSCKAIIGVADRLLFGGKKGVVETIGHFQMARGGTLYLSGISDLDQTAQAALVRLLDVRDAAPPGEADVGIVCGGHLLRVAVGDGKLREDLFKRLLETSVQLPSLRARRIDLIRLVQREVAAVGGESNVKLGSHPKLLEACALRPWPGNVRELRTAVRQAAAKALGDQREIVRNEDLLDTAGMPSGASGGAETAVERKSSPEQIDKAAVIAAMERTNGVLVAAARALGIHKNALLKLLDEHGLAYETAIED